MVEKGCGKAGANIGGQQLQLWAQQKLVALDPKLDDALGDVKQSAPNATVLLVGYPRLFPTDIESQACLTANVLGRLSQDDMNWLNDQAVELDRVMRNAAARNGVHFVSVLDAFTGHGVCGPDGEWIAGPTLPDGWDIPNGRPVGSGSFHPNLAGQQGYAAAVNDYLVQARANYPVTDTGLPENPAAAAAFSVQTVEAEDAAADLGDLWAAPRPGDPATACYPEGGVLPGSRELLAGVGFEAGAEVVLNWSYENGDVTDSVSLGSVTADDRGEIQAEVVVPDQSVGTYAYVTATGPGAAGRPLVLAELLLAMPQCPAEFSFDGFYAPVNNAPTVNIMNAGRAVPVKFSLGGDFGLDVLAVGYPTAARVSCSSSDAVFDEVEQTTTAGESGLSYDADTGQYSYVWKTRDAWSGTCRELTLRLRDGTTKSALFSFR